MSTEFLIAIMLGVISTLLVTVLLYLVKSQQHKKYDEENSRAVIESMRGSFEKRLYEMTERLTSTDDRWRDVNHLLIESQKSLDSTESPSNEIYLSEFIKSNGLTEKDLDVDKKLIFVLTPFHERYEHIYETIQSVCQSAGFKCIRGDEQFLKGDILHHILKGLAKCNIVIANIEGRNPNVLYELGLAHAMDKNTILLSKSVGDLPVDIKSKRILVYSQESDLRSSLKDELLKVLVADKNG